MKNRTLPLAILALILMKLIGRAQGAENQVPAAPTGLAKAMALLEQTTTGHQALLDAKNLKIPIQAGRISKTEITATRTIAPKAGEGENLIFNTQVLVAADKSPVFQALDLAHELVHAVHPKGNPFDPNLNAEDYVRHGIEGEGGEAPAIAQECRVGKELIAGASNEVVKTEMNEETAQLIKARCSYVWQMESNDRQWKQSFYHLGEYYHEFLGQVRRMNGTAESKAAWAQKVEPKSPMFASAVAHKPYPLALLEEYVQITRTICEKSMRSPVGREIASITALNTRCQSIENNVNE
jgi:hypothetical protein